MQSEGRRVPLPLSEDNARWRTVFTERTVLAIAHNVTSATRLLDLLALFDGDRRVETVFTCTGSSALDHGTLELFEARGVLTVPWDMAKERTFDLAIATSRGGDLYNLRTPLIGTPHGAGYNKLLNGSREAFGLTAEWLTHDGRVVPSAIVLSHEEQLARLAVDCLDAVPLSLVAGDPCFDELCASRPFRQEYRDALGVRPGQKLVVVSSTWGKGSALDATRPDEDVLRRTLAELPSDEYRVLAALHPNAWYGHGAWQTHTWLAPLLACGLLLPVPDSETWKAALLAADGLCGDHGSLTLYGVALGIPTVLGSFAEEKVAPRSPMARLGALVPRLSRHRPLLSQLRDAARRQADNADLAPLRSAVTSRPGEAARLLRTLFYERLALPEPDLPAAPRAVSVPEPPPAHRTSPVAAPMYVSSSVGAEGEPVTVRRFHAALQRPGQEGHLAGAHLVADIDDPDRRWPRSADVLYVPLGRGAGWNEERRAAAAARHPGCALIAVEEHDGGCLALFRDAGVRLRAKWLGPRPWWASAAVAASVLHDRILCGPGPADEHRAPFRVEVTIGEGAGTGLLDVTAL
ncbi:MULTISPECIES: hypothetical protein [unclassified Streptomyces]|uniref:hypothetical protein n=1 Tax=unclassified Streptomyces TaxID=2593676 RepID=UPI002E2D1DE5|nr:hypothetical protein [Streptomyces sp. NBC_00223]